MPWSRSWCRSNGLSQSAIPIDLSGTTAFVWSWILFNLPRRSKHHKICFDLNYSLQARIDEVMGSRRPTCIDFT